MYAVCVRGIKNAAGICHGIEFFGNGQPAAKLMNNHSFSANPF